MVFLILKAMNWRIAVCLLNSKDDGKWEGETKEENIVVSSKRFL